jgi:hypothetical protein
MIQRVDYYKLLARAVESLERDAYAARGAIYDREHKALLKRLISSSAPCSDAHIAREEQAFRVAVRRIEFPGDGVQAPRPPLREPAETAWPGSAREKARAPRREIPQEPANAPPRARLPEARREPRGRRDTGDEESSTDAPSPDTDLPPGKTRQTEPDWNGQEQKSRSLVRRTAGYLLAAAAVLGAASLGYAYVVGTIDLSWLTQTTAPRAQSQRAMLYEAGRIGKPLAGKAIWRTQTEPNGPAGKPDLVVTLDVEIPEQHIALAMSLSRVVDAGAGMSHLIELRFANPQELPFGGISRIPNIALKGTETESGESLMGTSINIAPGQFMFGLLGMEDVVRQNVQRLRTQAWLDFIIVFASGAAYTLTVEKGASGERALDEAFAKWGQ